MITKEEATRISKLIRLSDIQELSVIRRYIFDMKGIDVGAIQRPTDTIGIQLMWLAYESVSSYYAKL